MSFNGVLKYIIYGFTGGWLFLLGVMAGRGTAPVTFETRDFQERLKTIVEAYGDPEALSDPDEKMELRYYDALSDEQGFEEMVIPVPADVADDTPVDAGRLKTGSGKTPVHDTRDMTPADEIPVKISKKAATFNKSLAAKQAGPVPQESGTGVSAEKTEETGFQGRYTIQVAAFRSFRDAVTQMAELEKKGFSATRTAKEMDGTTWYRVRIGEFSSRDAAAGYLDQLNQAGVSGMIITKD